MASNAQLAELTGKHLISGNKGVRNLFLPAESARKRFLTPLFDEKSS